jgi:hypothetical protein
VRGDPDEHITQQIRPAVPAFGRPTMTDLHRQLAALAGPEVPPTWEDVNSDLYRGWRALRRRRTLQKIAGATLAVAALAAGLHLLVQFWASLDLSSPFHGVR